jgi:endonuclease/exonuclease/phosphatase (EEP) superfamily protein YafD|tara:strand:- start:1982 stop:2743 length:762 start_codon:yes stop_codon:yes gene_type:complete
MASIKLLTLNTWLKEGPYEQREQLIRSWIERLEPDLIGFQEILEEQAGELLDELGYVYEWHFGMSIASRWKIENFQTADLPAVDDKQVAGPILGSHVDSPYGLIPFVNTTTFYYLPQDGWKRKRQMPVLNNFVRDIRIRGGFPVVLVGDFNTDSDTDEIRYLKGLHSIDDTSTYFSDAWERAGDGGMGATWARRNDYSKVFGLPDRRIDYIFVGAPAIQGPGRVQTCQVVCDEPVDGVWPSDHFGVFAELSAE